MPDTANTCLPPSRRPFGTPVRWAIVVIATLLVIAAALVFAAANPVMVDRLVVVVGGLLVVAIGAVVKMALTASAEMRRMTSNDDWIYW